MRNHSRFANFSLMSVLLIFLISCSKEKDTSLELKNLVIGSQSVMKSLDLDYIKNDIQIYPLVNSIDLIIGHIQYMDFLGSNVVLFDNMAHQILIFNSSYELIKRIEAQGEGSGEFKFLECFFIDKEKKEVVVFDSRLFKFLTYDINGEFIQEKKVKYFARDIFKSGNNWLINNAWSDDKSSPYQIFIANEEFEIINKLKRQNKSIVSTIANPEPFINTVNNGIIYQEPLSDTLYQLNSSLDKLTPILTFDFQSLKYPEELLYSKRMREFVSQASSSNYRGWVRNVSLNDGNLLFQFFQTNGAEKLENVMAFSNENELKLFHNLTISGGLKITFPKLIKEGKYFSVLSSEEIEQYLSTHKLSDLNEQILNSIKFKPNSTMTYLVRFNL